MLGLVWSAESAFRRWTGDDGGIWAATATATDVAVAVGFGSAVAAESTAKSLRDQLGWVSSPQVRAEFESAAMRLEIALGEKLPGIDALFERELVLRDFCARDSWQFLVDALPSVCGSDGGAAAAKATLLLPAVIAQAAAGEPRIRLCNVRALAFFRLGNVAAAEEDLSAAEIDLDDVRSSLVRSRLGALLQSNRARLLADTPRVEDAYAHATRAVTAVRLEGSEFSAFWFHAQRGCSIAARCGRFDEFWELISSRVPAAEPLDFGDDPFHAYKSYQAFLETAAAELGRLGRTAEMERLRIRRLRFLRTHLPGWAFPTTAPG